MARTLFVCALLTAGLSASPPQTGPKPTETFVRLTVPPMAVPRPALKYQLLPELKEMNPGNPVQGYLLCFMEQQNFFFSKTAVENRERWQVMPLRDLPLKELTTFGYGNRGALNQADYAARLESPDWQVLLKAKRDGVGLLLPEIQQLRMLASALKVRFRLEVAERRFDAAIRTAQTLFALSRHLGSHPTLIGNLVGIAVASIALGPLEEMLQQPGCPNLFWALTDLPTPLVGFREGLRGDRLMSDVELVRVDAAAPMSAAQLKATVAHFIELVQDERKPKRDISALLEARVQDEGFVTAARRRLVEAGLAEDRLRQLPALQVVLLDEKREFEERRDEGMKWLSLPYWQAEAGYLADPAVRSADDTLLVGGFVSALLKVRRAQARLEQRIALLRHIEALRLYAAGHDGRLPARLEDVPVPLPVDPFNGKPFGYQVEGETATVRGSPPKGEEATAVYNLRYVVTIQK